MSRRARRAIALGLGGLYLAGTAFIAGVLAERVRFDLQRTALVQELHRLQTHLHTRLMELERPRDRWR